MLRVICLLLLLCGLVSALDELEYDALVAPPAPAHKPSLSLWRGLVGQVREVIGHWRSTTKRPRPHLRSTTPAIESDAELQFYGALNPIYQTQNF
ncbi:uncharacterized protein [Drosophila virilis]|uniref:uncharacterized protein n=1 Tax=Drosophila virilis TaxID=7244 RepID=UPI00017D611F